MFRKSILLCCIGIVAYLGANCDQARRPISNAVSSMIKWWIDDAPTQAVLPKRAERPESRIGVDDQPVLFPTHPIWKPSDTVRPSEDKTVAEAIAAVAERIKDLQAKGNDPALPLFERHLAELRALQERLDIVNSTSSDPIVHQGGR